MIFLGMRSCNSLEGKECTPLHPTRIVTRHNKGRDFTGDDKR
jgi:hypothetical protein